MAERNRYGLSRYIPKDIARDVRRRCGFGCVICGSALYTYEHMAPRFADAKKHTASCITLLCGQHQAASTKGLLSLATIHEADKDPFCRRAGAAQYLLDIGQNKPVIMLGGNNVIGPSICVNGKPIFLIRPPERHSRLWRISAVFRDTSGKTLCQIIDNEIAIAANNVDFEQTSSRFVVSTDDEPAFLELEANPPNGIALNKFRVETSGGTLRIGMENIANPGEAPNEQLVLAGGGGKIVNCVLNYPNGIDFKLENGTFSF